MPTLYTFHNSICTRKVVFTLAEKDRATTKSW